MNLLGNYPSGLVTQHYEQLLALLNQSLAAGDYGGGTLVDAAVIAQLQQHAQDFSSLPAIASGSRATADQILYLMDILSARYGAISAECQAFLDKMSGLLGVLESESGLIDQLLAQGNLELWVARRGPLSEAAQFYQDFSATHGPTDISIPLIDPSSSLLIPAQVQNVDWMLNPIAGLEAEPVRRGVAAGTPPVRHAPISLSWQYPSGSLQEDNETGPDWGLLSLLETKPLLTYGPPALTPITYGPTGVNAYPLISGTSLAGNVPVYVQIVKVERLLKATVRTSGAGVAVTFSQYPITGNQFTVLDTARSYDQGIDYTVNPAGQFVPTSVTANKTLTVLYTAMFPGYRGSLNQLDWSSTLLFDSARPYPDGVTGPVQIIDNQFPVLDDQDYPLGLFLSPQQIITGEGKFVINTPVMNSYGITATLTVQLDKPTYVDGLHLAPFSQYPVHLQRINACGMTADSTTTVWSGDLTLDRPLSIRFARQLVSQFQVVLYQENYTYQSYVLDALDKLRRDALVNIQSVLPFSFRRINISKSSQVSGAQYDLGIADIYGEDNGSDHAAPAVVIVSGPMEIEGTPELLRLDAEYCGVNTKFYLIDVPFGSNGVKADSALLVSHPNGFPVTPGTAFSYIPPSAIPVTSKVQFYIKVVLSDAYAVLERILMQSTTV